MSSVIRALLASAAAIGILTVSLHFGSSGASWPLHDSGDSVSKANAEVRAQQFAMLASLTLSPVATTETAAAIDSMQLEPAAKSALANRISTASTQASPSSERERLAWVTLWDTDAEDGDVVRLDSAGYSRTITLTKKPVTFAVPVPRDGVIKVTGIRDGEGGGITVGLASGASQAIFPIMSVGQTLGLKVSFDP